MGYLKFVRFLRGRVWGCESGVLVVQGCRTGPVNLLLDREPSELKLKDKAEEGSSGRKS